jgi:hypothetical protein
LQANAADLFFLITSFHSSGYNRFSLGTAATLAGSLATDDKLIDFNASG